MRRALRRVAIILLSISPLASVWTGRLSACEVGNHPAAATMLSGDLLWPKVPGTPIPYSGTSADDERITWARDIEALLATPAAQLSDEQLKIRNRLRELSYDEFYAGYYEGQELGVPGLRSSGGSIVGHVAIVDVDPSGVRYVVEAMPKLGVRRILLSDWLAERECQAIWLGRINKLTKTEREKIADEAKRYIGRPYVFVSWGSFRLDDETSFYCSKLVWLSVRNATGIAIDGQSEPSRYFWLSPKQLINAPVIQLLHNPGQYGTR